MNTIVILYVEFFRNMSKAIFKTFHLDNMPLFRNMFANGKDGN